MQQTLGAFDNVEDAAAKTRDWPGKWFHWNICTDCGSSQMVRNGTCLSATPVALLLVVPDRIT